jgi:hypothetical protein
MRHDIVLVAEIPNSGVLRCHQEEDTRATDVSNQTLDVIWGGFIKWIGKRYGSYQDRIL